MLPAVSKRDPENSPKMRNVSIYAGTTDAEAVEEVQESASRGVPRGSRLPEDVDFATESVSVRK